jgi:hypothetical protein
MLNEIGLRLLTFQNFFHSKAQTSNCILSLRCVVPRFMSSRQVGPNLAQTSQEPFTPMVMIEQSRHGTPKKAVCNIEGLDGGQTAGRIGVEFGDAWIRGWETLQ